MQDTLGEWKLLASFMNHPDALYSTTRNIFTEERQDVYDAMVRSYAQFGEISLEGVKHHLGGDLPSELAINVTINPQSLIAQLTPIARRRQLADAGNRLRTLSADFIPDEDQVRSALTFDPIAPTQDVTLQSGVMHLHSDIKRKRSGSYVFATTGLKIFDAMMGGEWPRRALVVIKARPGVGKTALACTTMLHMAEHHKIPSHFWSLEMAKEQLMIRWVANKASIDNTDILIGANLTDAQLRKIEQTSVYVQGLPMTVSERRPTLDDILTETHYLARNGTRVFLFDYIQICGITKFGNRNQDLGYFAYELKELAKKHDVTMVALSQMNDQQEVRDSGEVEQVADVSIAMNPDDVPAGDDGVAIVKVRWDKNRFGPVGKEAAIRFNGKFQRFSNLGDEMIYEEAEE